MQWRLDVEPKGGWDMKWRKGVIVAVVILSLLISLLLYLLLASRWGGGTHPCAPAAQAALPCMSTAYSMCTDPTSASPVIRAVIPAASLLLTFSVHHPYVQPMYGAACSL